MKWSKECCLVLWWMTDLKSQIASLSLSIQKMMQTLMKKLRTSGRIIESSRLEENYKIIKFNHCQYYHCNP
ncbi:hypothetical protein Nmel_001774 [Mimus melanotis]